MSLRQSVFASVRKLHCNFADRGLPDRIAIYLHALDSADLDAFKRLVGCFHELGYSFCTPEQFLQPNCGKQVFLSFDDNYLSWRLALPEFDRLRVLATFYVNTLPLRGEVTPDLLRAYFQRIHYSGTLSTVSRAEIKELMTAGHTIACHSHSHFVLSALECSEACKEISKNKEILEDILGKEVKHFSFPKGMRRHFSRRLGRFCFDIGFQTIATARPGRQHANLSNGYVHRTLWRLDAPVEQNLSNLRIDGRIFEFLTGRSPIG